MIGQNVPECCLFAGRRHSVYEGSYRFWCQRQLQERLWADPTGSRSDALPSGDYRVVGVCRGREWTKYKAGGPRDPCVGGSSGQRFNICAPRPPDTAK